jgi:hypothetical protein
MVWNEPQIQRTRYSLACAQCTPMELKSSQCTNCFELELLYELTTL